MKLQDIKLAVQAALAVIASYFAGLSVTTKILLVLVAADYATGVLAAFVLKSLSSDIGFRGIAKKCLTLIAVAAAHHVGAYFDIGIDLGSAVALFYAINEALSIFENLARAGVPVPQHIVDALARLKAKEDVGNAGAERKAQ